MPAKKRSKYNHKRSKTRRRQGFFALLRHRLPGWTWLLGGIAMMGLYIWGFWYFFVSPYGIRWKAIYGEIDYPAGYNIHGIDVSHYQGTIDWELLRNRGTIDECPIRFVMIKATEGTDRLDAKFKRNFSKAHEYGFTRGAYHFYSMHSDAAAQARFFIKNVDLKKGDLPPVLDVEHKPQNKSKQQFKQDVLCWLRIVEKHYGVKPILYTYYRFKQDYLNDTIFNQYPYWIAHYYVDSVSYKGPWKFWQHTDMGQLPGIKGKVDLNIYNGSYYELRQLTIGSQETIGVDAYKDE
ncbi:MAG: glycoside hydrolase family 25 protein [Prevotella sp.]|nr:glycoside hydrolase family 25 protein [Prevotella sp.]